MLILRERQSLYPDADADVNADGDAEMALLKFPNDLHKYPI